MNILDTIKREFHHGNSTIQLILINAGVFLLINLILIALTLFNNPENVLLSYLALPASLPQILTKFWTPFTYMFLHQNIWHLLFNMYSLYWFGKLFLLFFSEKQLVGLYIFGGLIAALLYIISFNSFPYFATILNSSILLGASGSIMAIILATSVHSPNMELQLMLFGRVKLKYIAAVFVLMSIFGITSSNSGGEIAHLGGALAGYLFVVSLRQGKDLTSVINRIIGLISNVFSRKKLKIKPNSNPRRTPMSDADFNATRAKKMAQIDQILDKIKKSGYESLSTEEKKQLFEQGNKK